MRTALGARPAWELGRLPCRHTGSGPAHDPGHLWRQPRAQESHTERPGDLKRRPCVPLAPSGGATQEVHVCGRAGPNCKHSFHHSAGTYPQLGIDRIVVLSAQAGWSWPVVQYPRGRSACSTCLHCGEADCLRCFAGMAPRIFGSTEGSSCDMCCRLEQVWARPGRLPREVEALAGGFTDAATTCPVDGEAEQGQAGGGIASWWRYQGFRL